MPVPNYGVLTGTVVDKLDSVAALKRFPKGSPHYQILLDVNGSKYRVAVNVKSDETPVNLLFFLDDNYQNPILNKIQTTVGFTPLSPNATSGALDFLRLQLFDLSKMRVVPAASDPISGNDLNDIFTVYINQAQNTPGALVYAFGSKWPDDGQPDQYFFFQPSVGIHDIHMNQGDSVQKDANGIFQDGALLIFYPDEKRWVAMFLKFQSQSIRTDNNGNPL